MGYGRMLDEGSGSGGVAWQGKIMLLLLGGKAEIEQQKQIPKCSQQQNGP